MRQVAYIPRDPVNSPTAVPLDGAREVAAVSDTLWARDPVGPTTEVLVNVRLKADDSVIESYPNCLRDGSIRYVNSWVDIVFDGTKWVAGGSWMGRPESPNMMQMDSDGLTVSGRFDDPTGANDVYVEVVPVVSAGLPMSGSLSLSGVSYLRLTNGLITGYG